MGRLGKLGPLPGGGPEGTWGRAGREGERGGPEARGGGPRAGAGRPGLAGAGGRVFFLYFLKLFFTEIYFQFHNLQFCTPTARLRGGRDLNVNKIYF